MLLPPRSEEADVALVNAGHVPGKYSKILEVFVCKRVLYKCIQGIRGAMENHERINCNGGSLLLSLVIIYIFALTQC